MAKSMNLKDLDISSEELSDIIEFLARRRNVSNYERMANEELLSTPKETSYLPSQPLKLGKWKSNHILTTQPPQKMAKLEINQNLTLHRPIKIAKRRKNQNLTPQKQEKSKNNQQQIISENKKRIGIIREEIKELSYKLSKSELKEIKRRLYMVENKKGLLG